MKKALVLFTSLLLIFLLVLTLIPSLFKGKIQGMMDMELEDKFDVPIYYDKESFELSFYIHFPYLTAELSDIQVLCKDPFGADTLLSAQEFQIALSPFKALFSQNLELKQVFVIQPKIKAKVYCQYPLKLKHEAHCDN